MTSTEMTELVTLCAVEEIPLGLARAFNVNGQSIAVFRTRAGSVHAVENHCPHRRGVLSEGMLAGDQIVCPMHAFRFDLQSGSCDQPGVCAIKTFPVQVRDGLVQLSMENLQVR